MSNNIAEIYAQKSATGPLRPDQDQLRAVQMLEKLRQALTDSSLSGRIPVALPRFWKKKPAPKGYYLHGGVGRGKSMVMDLFFDAVEIEKKRRVHFHAFMLETHDFLHTARTARKPDDKIDDDLMAAADKIAANTRLLCFDEFQVNDVADAMILGRLFTALFARGVVMVITSNTAPDDLYADGLQRDRFLPFIALLKNKLHVFPFPGMTDYRLDKLKKTKTYFCPHTAESSREMDKIFDLLADNKPGAALDISVKGRVIHVPLAARDVAAFSFAELCEQPKSALDYLQLAGRFKIFIVKDVPVLTEKNRDAALRFVTFIDTLYDHRTRLVMSAAAPADQLCGTFQRTASRLMEMQSQEYGAKEDV